MNLKSNIMRKSFNNTVIERGYKNTSTSETVNVSTINPPFRVIGGKIVNLKQFSPECYFKDPITGVEGWDIQFPIVWAIDKSEAKSLISKMPNFDCFIEQGW